MNKKLALLLVCMLVLLSFAYSQTNADVESVLTLSRRYDVGDAHPDFDASVDFNADGEIDLGDIALMSKDLQGGHLILPRIIPVSGEYYSPLTITIEHDDPGVIIFYTTNGSRPSIRSTRYTAPFDLTEPSPVKAKAFSNDLRRSPVAKSHFRVSEQCSMDAAVWQRASANEGEAVGFSLTGNCDSYTIEIYEQDTLADDFIRQLNRAQRQWVAEWQCDGNIFGICTAGDPEYYILVSFEGETIRSGLLTVAPSDIAPAPLIEADSEEFYTDLEITLRLQQPNPDADIYYTLDGSAPDNSSYFYNSPFTITETATVRARTLIEGSAPSTVNTQSYTRLNNQQPSVDAGSDITIQLPQDSALLSAAASDDGGLQPLAYQWIATPDAGVQITTPTSASTTVTLPSSGVYTFTIIVDDGEFQVADSLQLTLEEEANTAPSVALPGDTSVQLPNDFMIDAAVTDDGRPGSLVYLWEASPSFGVTFDPDDQEDTTVSFTGPGTYTITLTADDTALQESDSMVVTVVEEDENLPPNVDAGIDQEIILPTSQVTLSGSASDSDGPSALVTTWSQVSGPNTASIAEAGSLSTTASGLVEGTYVFRLTADDSENSTTDDMTVTVNAQMPDAELPVIAPPSGTYQNSASITITTNTPGATIYYTLDGTDPDQTDTLYSGAFILSQTADVRARAYASGHNPSAIASNSYTIQTTACVESALTTPLTDLTGTYQGENGGLYPDGSTTRPFAHEQQGAARLAEIQKLDVNGNPSDTGRIVMVSIGMSNTQSEFGNFRNKANADPSKNPDLYISNTAVSGAVASSWADRQHTVWSMALNNVQGDPNQVQIAWVKLTNIGSGEFMTFQQQLESDLSDTIDNMLYYFPNLKVIYFSSRTMAHVGGGLSPEPTAYETAYPVKWIIDKQMQGTDYNINTYPWITWGPYVWTQGIDGRSDGLVSTCDDVTGDYTHPSASGNNKVGDQLLAFFKTDPTATPWFLKPSSGAPTISSTTAIPSNPEPGQEVQFSATATDSDGIAEYVWTFDDGTFSYNPSGDPNYMVNQNPIKTFYVEGTYDVHLTVMDNNGNTATQTVTVTVAEQTNNPPVAQNQVVNTDQDQSAQITLQFTDADVDDTHSITITDQPDHGSLSGSGTNLVYDPDPGYYGQDTFIWQVSDGSASDQATVTINVAQLVSCTLSNPRWSVSSAEQNDVVTLLVDSDCPDGTQITFGIWEHDLLNQDDPAIQNASDAIVQSGTASSTWTAEWQCDGNVFGVCTAGTPEYYFIAYKIDDRSENVQSSTITTSASNTVADPVISPSETTHTDSVSVTMSTSTPNAQIYYTLDGTDPDSSDNLYSGAIQISSSRQVRARALRDSYQPSGVASRSYTINSGGERIDNIYTNELIYPNSAVPKYDKLEITFDVDTLADNPQLPYDSNPPSGLQSGLGVSVDALFSPDNWQTTYRMPAFYYQEYLNESRGSSDWLYPTDNFVWKARFAPPTSGVWQYRLAVNDTQGYYETTAQTFSVVDSNNPGYLRVSDNDSRYFEFENGQYDPQLGYSLQYVLRWDNPMQDNRQTFENWQQNGMTYGRHWLWDSGIFGSPGPWETVRRNYFWSISQTYEDSEVSVVLVNQTNECLFVGWQKPSPAVKQNTNYRVRVRFYDAGMNGEVNSGLDSGFVAKTGGWLWTGSNSPGDCSYPGTGDLIAATYNGDASPDPVDANWQILEGTWNSGNNHFLPFFYLALENVRDGRVYIDHVWIEEDLGGGQYGPNIMYKPWMAHHYYFDQRSSFAYDKILELAEDYDVYLRPTLLEDFWIFQNTHPDGTIGYYDNVNYFFGDRTMTKNRWLQEAFYRYAQARWGYSTNIHSWEFMNEGDPNNHLHFVATDEMAEYLHQFTPNDHMVSTSTWHSFPNYWTDPSFDDIDYADEHNYIFDDEPGFTDAAFDHYELSMLRGADQPGGAGMPVIRGEVGFVENGDTNAATTQLYDDTEGIWLHNFVWAFVNPGGLIDAGNWFADPHIYCLRGACVNQYDHRDEFRNYYDFIITEPLNNGNYEDAQATSTDADLRVWGQKDLVNGRAHLWIQNSQHTWYNVVNNPGSISTQSATVTIPGFAPNTIYNLEWWNTYTGAVSSTEQVTSNAQGDVSFSVSTSTDVAVKIIGSGGQVNTAPSANAGTDQSITLPASATLTGSATDDGDPNPPGALTYAWSMVSGPAAVSFSNQNSASASATFTTAGVYVIRLTVSDGALSDTDDLTVTVSDIPNELPEALMSATPDSGTAPLQVSFDGSSSSDSDGTIVSYQWTFGDGQSATGVTSVHTYQNPGTYNAILEVFDDDGGSHTDIRQISVNSAVNQAPVAQSASVTVFRDVPEQINLLYTDSDGPGPYTFSHSNPSHGALSGVGSTLIYDPDPGYTGSDSFTWTVSDGSDTSNTATITINVNEPLAQSGTIIDHTSLEAFDRIPGQYIDAAGALRVFFLDRSVGGNIYDGWVCMRSETQAEAANHCRRYEHNGYDPYFTSPSWTVEWSRTGGYPSQNWMYEFWGDDPQSSNGGESGWSGNVQYFISAIDHRLGQFDVVSYQQSYLQVDSNSDIASTSNGFFTDNPTRTDVNDLEAYESQHPDKIFVHWTSSLARGIGTTAATQYNEQMRDYARNNDRYLLDAADIESHDPYGQPCYDNRDGVEYCGRFDNTLQEWVNCENHADDGQSILAICQHYTTETDGGHLYSPGKILISKAWWVLMSCIAGWDDPVCGSGGSAGNYAPAVSAGADQSITLPTNQVSLDATALDDQTASGSLSYSWTRVSGPAAVSFGNAIAADTTATFSTAGTYILRLSVSDGSLSGTDDVTITVTDPNANEAPTASFTANPTSGIMPLDVNFDASASTDSDGSIVSYIWNFGDTNTATGQTASHTYTSADTYTVTLTVTDDDSETGQTTTQITVNAQNQAPTVDVGGDRSVSLSSSMDIDATASDDVAVTSYTWTRQSGPGTATFTPNNAEDTSVSFSEVGTYVLRLTVGDGEFTAYDELTVTVTDSQGASLGVIEAEDYKSGGEGVGYHDTTTGNLYDGSWPDDVDVWDNTAGASGGQYVGHFRLGEWLAYDVEIPSSAEYNFVLTAYPSRVDEYDFDIVVDGTPHSVIFDASTANVWLENTFEGITLPQGTVEIKLQVNTNGLEFDKFEIQSTSGNNAPQVTVPAGQAITLPDNQVIIDASAIDSDGPSAMTYQWTSSPSSGVSFSSATSVDTTATFPTDGTYTLTLEAFDGELTGSDSLVVTVYPEGVNQLPVVEAGGPYTVTLPDSSAALAATATDSDGPSALTYSWTQVSGPSTATIGSPASLSSLMSALVEGTYEFNFSAYDGEDIASDIATVTVGSGDPNNPPVANDMSRLTYIDTPIDISLSASDADDDPLTYEIVTQPGQGELSGTGDTRTYTPGSGYGGTDSFTFRVNDGEEYSNTATVSINVQQLDSGEHPYMIVTEDMYADLIDKGTREPWLSMKNDAINKCLNTDYLEPDGSHPTDSEISYRISRIANTCTLAYIADPGNQAAYRQKIVDTLPYWTDIEQNQPSSAQPWWSRAVKAYFYAVLALDVIHDDLTPQQLAELEGPLAETFQHAYDAPEVTRHPPTRETFMIMWKLYTRNHTEMEESLLGGLVDNGRPYIGDSNIVGYVPEFMLRIGEAGPYNEGPGYAHSAWAYDRDGRTHLIEVLEFTGTDALYGIDFYDNQRWEDFYEWLYGYASTPFGMHTTFGDTSGFRLMADDHATEDRFINNNHMLTAGLFSQEAGQYAMWKNREYPFEGHLISYLYLTDPLPEPATPPSKIFNPGGAFFLEYPADDYSLYGALWNQKYDSTEVFHVRKDTNALYIAAYGSGLLMNGGFCGASTAAGPDACTYNAPDGTRHTFTTNYLGHRALSNNVAMVDYTVTPPYEDQGRWWYDPTDVNDHANKVGGGFIEGFTTPTFDYAVGTTEADIDGQTYNSLATGTHYRNFIMVHPTDGAPGYFAVFDEVDGINGLPVNLIFRPNSWDIQTVSSLEEYDAPVGRIGNAEVGPAVPNNPSSGLTLYFATPPDSIEFHPGIIASWTYGGSFIDYFFNTYQTTGDSNQILTILFPYDSTHPKASMSRLSGSGYTGAVLDHGAGVVDYAVESHSTGIVSTNGITFDGQNMLARIVNSDGRFYFARQATQYRYSDIGFTSDSAVSIYMNGIDGKISSSGAQLTLYYPDILGIEVDGSSAVIVDSGTGYASINVPSGEHELTILTSLSMSSQSRETFTFETQSVDDEPAECTLSSIAWSQTEAFSGDIVHLVIDAAGCGGEVADLEYTIDESLTGALVTGNVIRMVTGYSIFDNIWNSIVSIFSARDSQAEINEYGLPSSVVLDEDGAVIEWEVLDVGYRMRASAAIGEQAAESGYLNLGTALPPPQISLEGGSYDNYVTVELVGEGTIRFTTDGSDPDETAIAYNGPIIISETTTLKARSFQPGFIGSRMVQETYDIRRIQPVELEVSDTETSDQEDEPLESGQLPNQTVVPQNPNVTIPVQNITFNHSVNQTMNVTLNETINQTGENITANIAPIVDAGTDLEVIVGENVFLSGIVSDDGLPNPPGIASVLWSAEHASVQLNNAASLYAEAVFSQAGVYTVRLTADDGEYSVSDEILVTVSEQQGSDLVAYYSFDQPVSLEQNNVNWTSEGYSGGAYQIFEQGYLKDQSDNYDLETFTVSAWVKSLGNSGNPQFVINKDFSLSYRLFVKPSATQFGFGIRTDSGSKAVYGDFPLNEWVHLAATYDGSSIKAYKNGVLVSQAAHSGPILDGDNRIYIGAYSETLGYFNGYIDELRIYNRALNGQEIANLS